MKKRDLRSILKCLKNGLNAYNLLYPDYSWDHNIDQRLVIHSQKNALKVAIKKVERELK